MITQWSEVYLTRYDHYRKLGKTPNEALRAAKKDADDATLETDPNR